MRLRKGWLRSRWQRLREVSADDRWLLVRAAIVLLVARLFMLGFGWRVARRLSRLAAVGTHAPTIDRAVWAVSAMARYVPGANCLTQSVALQAILAANGVPSRVEIGVRTAPIFSAHAWVVNGGRVVLGGGNLEHYARITSWEEK